MSYISGSEGPSVSGYDVQGPKKLPDTAFGSAITPAVRVVQDQGASEIVIVAGSGSYFFASATASVGTTLAADDAAGTLSGDGVSMVSNVAYFGSSGSVGGNPPPLRFTYGPLLRLPISANVWSGSGGPADGDVIFVKRGGL